MSVPGWWAGAEAAVVDAVGESIPGWLPDLGAGTLLALTMYLVLTGRLVPQRTVQRIEAERDKALQAVEVQAQTIREQAEGNRITRDVLVALEKLASQKDSP